MKPRHQREIAQEILSKEIGYVRKPHANRLRVALIFPNTYFVGMSNLGFQTIYRLFNDDPDIVCERAFLPPKQELAALREAGTRIVTLESQTPVADFDIIAFSVSFEWDYTNVLTMLRLAGVPVRAADRDYTHPLIVIGGAVDGSNEVQYAVKKLDGGTGKEVMTLRVYLLSEIEGTKPIKAFEYQINAGEPVKPFGTGTFVLDPAMVAKLNGK